LAEERRLVRGTGGPRRCVPPIFRGLSAMSLAGHSLQRTRILTQIALCICVSFAIDASCCTNERLAASPVGVRSRRPAPAGPYCEAGDGTRTHDSADHWPQPACDRALERLASIEAPQAEYVWG
jgi:hypothetical protein